MPYEPVNVECLKDAAPWDTGNRLLDLSDINAFLDTFTRSEAPGLFKRVPIFSTTGRQP